MTDAITFILSGGLVGSVVGVIGYLWGRHTGKHESDLEHQAEINALEIKLAVIKESREQYKVKYTAQLKEVEQLHKLQQTATTLGQGLNTVVGAVKAAVLK